MQKSHYEITDIQSLNGSSDRLINFFSWMAKRNFDVKAYEGHPGKLVPYHAHAHEEVILVKKGGLRFIIEEDIIDLKQGELITIKPWAIHLIAFPLCRENLYYVCHPRKKIKSLG